MATFDQLTAEQRAIVELVLKQGKTYDDLADLLGMPETRVRDLARDALISLSPMSAERVEEDWRGQLSDYVLGQQSGPESTATRGHLRRSEAARTWTRSLLDALESFYPGDLPTIPEGERGRARERGRRERPEPEREEREERDLSPGAKAAVRRRRLVAGLGALAVLILLAVLVWPVGVLVGEDDEGGGEQASSPASPVGQTRGNRPAGIAIVAQRDGQKQVVVQAANLPPNKSREAYEVWLYNSPGDAKSLGAQTTDPRGTYQGAGPLPADFQRFKFIDVSREPIDRNRKHSGQSVLRGPVGKLDQPSGTKKGQASVLGQIVLAPPAS